MIMRGTTLEEIDSLSVEQTIIFYNNETGHIIEYVLKRSNDRNQYFCNCPQTDNDLIFKFLKINKQNFQEKVLGYRNEGQFPYCCTLEDMKTMLRELWKLYYCKVLESLNYRTLSIWPNTMRLMCQMQMEQGNPVNPTIFLKDFAASKQAGGIDWIDTPHEYNGLFSMLNSAEAKDRDKTLEKYLKFKSESTETQTLTLKTTYHAIKLQDKKASVRRGNLPEGDRKRSGKSKTAVVCGHLRNRICHS